MVLSLDDFYVGKLRRAADTAPLSELTALKLVGARAAALWAHEETGTALQKLGLRSEIDVKNAAIAAGAARPGSGAVGAFSFGREDLVESRHGALACLVSAVTRCHHCSSGELVVADAQPNGHYRRLQLVRADSTICAAR